jgi:hypothetical protein
MGPPGSGCPSHSEGKGLENQWVEMTEKKSPKKQLNALHRAFWCYNDSGFLARAGESPHLFGSHHQPPFC